MKKVLVVSFKAVHKTNGSSMVLRIVLNDPAPKTIKEADAIGEKILEKLKKDSKGFEDCVVEILSWNELLDDETEEEIKEKKNG